MSFNRLRSDKEAYEHTLRESTGTGAYQLGRPNAACSACLQTDPSMHAFGNVDFEVDVSSDLLGITRASTKAPGAQYIPSSKEPSAGVPAPCAMPHHPEDTRLSNPPITLRSTGWNRFEPLCRDPQANAIPQFDMNVCNRIIAEGNHRAYLEQPIDQSAALPSANGSDEPVPGAWTKQLEQAPSLPPSTSWKPCNY